MNNGTFVKNLNRVVPILEVSNFKASMDYYQNKLGFRKNWEVDGFGSVSRDQVELFLSCNPNGNFGCAVYVDVRNIKTLYAELLQRGADITMEPRKQEWGAVEVFVEDPDGHSIRFSQAFASEETVVERVELSGRVEKRLAAVIRDLAIETGRTVGEVIEEVFLHSFEPVPGMEGQACASPHDVRTLERIEALKRKHQLDYDTHANYSFVEKEEQ